LSSVKSRAFFLFIPRKANEKISGGRKIRNKNRWHCDRSLKNLGGNTRRAYGSLMSLLGANDDIVLQAAPGKMINWIAIYQCLVSSVSLVIVLCLMS